MDERGSDGPAEHRGRILLGSTLALVIGATIMILMHETSHAVIGALLGYHPVQLPFAVDYVPEPAVSDHVLELLAGPAFSLVSGGIGLIVEARRQPLRDQPFWRLVWLWWVFTSLQEGLGYMQVTAFMPAGDTGQALVLLDAPPAAYLTMTAVGWALLPLTARAFSRPMADISSSDAVRTTIAMHSWLLGTAGMIVLMGAYVLLSPIDDAGVVVAVLAGATSIGIFAPISMMFRSREQNAAAAPAIPWPPVGGIAALVVLVLVNLLLTRAWFWV